MLRVEAGEEGSVDEEELGRDELEARRVAVGGRGLAGRAPPKASATSAREMERTPTVEVQARKEVSNGEEDARAGRVSRN